VPELVSSSFEDYEERAVYLAMNRGTALRDLRAKVCENRLKMPLFDTALWVKHLEMGLVEAWRLYSSEGGKKDHIDLSYLN